MTLPATHEAWLTLGNTRIRDSHAAQHTDPLPKSMLCVHRVAACDLAPDIDPAPPASPLSEPVDTPTEELPLPLSYCATCIPCILPAVDPPLPPSSADPATPVAILAFLLSPDDIGVPYPTGVDIAGLASLSDCW
jgi:hypothetical protein